MSPHDSARINADNERRIRRTDRAVNAIFAAILGIIGALLLVHSRFSTNTFPSWPLAHPYRYLAHNGEINTVQGNRNWMRAREALLATDLIPRDSDGRGIERLLPILDESASDSASFDACLELLHMGGRSLPHAVLISSSFRNTA